MSGSTEARGRRVLTPAVTAATAFAVLAAIVSVAFVSARGGLELPVAASATPGIAAASAPPATMAAAATPAPTTPANTTGPTTAPSPPASAGPTEPLPTAASSGPADPLAGLPPCPGHPGCFEYTVRRGDSFTAVSDRYGLLLWITRALNPEVTDERVITIGQTLYLGHDPTVRLDPCPDGAPCHLYVVRSGDTISAIAGRYGLSVQGILELNPTVDPSLIFTGQVIRLPLYTG